MQYANFRLGRNPVVKKVYAWEKFIPKPYKCVLTISADFELAWAWRYAKCAADPYEFSKKMAQQERENIPRILELCEKNHIPITWLTVGHLFLDSCTKILGESHPELSHPKQFENEWWKFSGKDWFEYDPASNFIDEPYWYCPDLVRMIVASKVQHEIGCHTFSHIDCRDNICSPEDFRLEIEACKNAATSLGINNMVSFVHPGHTIGNLPTLAQLGFTNFRTDYENVLGYPIKHESGLWEFSTTLEIQYMKGWPISWQIHRYIDTIKRAIKNHTMVYFWFHPSFDPVIIENILPAVFEWLDKNREEIWITNSGDYTNWLNANTDEIR